MTRSRDSEFPLLKPMGLKARPIRGDGNCLFNALSDQIYGDESRHAEIRSRVIEFMRENPDTFKPFLSVGDARRNPKRKNAGSLPSHPFTFTRATPAEVDAAYEAHLVQMAKGGTWGDNIEIIAFSYAYNTDVKIYKTNHAYFVRVCEDTTGRPVAHIAYHAWEHYSSIRNINGPMTGLPNVQVIEPDEDSATDDTSSATQGPDPGKVKAVNGFLPHIIDEAAIVKALEECSGNANSAVNKLLDADYISSQPSTPVQSSPGSSSVERDSDSDDEESRRPTKRQNRSRMADKAATAENEKVINEVASISGSPSIGLKEDSDESIRGSTRRRKRVIKAAKAFRKEKEERKRLAELTAASSTAAPSTASPSSAAAYIDLTTSDSEFEPEPELPVKLLQPDNISSELPLSKIKSEAEDEVALPPQSLSTNVKLATSEFKSEDEADRIAQFDGEADDEYRPDGEDDIESDFEEPISPTSPTTPATPPSSPGSASSRKERKTIPSANRVQKSPRKDGKRSKPSCKLLDSTVKSLNSNGTLSPVKKAVGMKVLFI